MASLLEELKLLEKPAPSRTDIEDLDNDLTAAKLIDRHDFQDNETTGQVTPSSLRKKAAVLLEDERYTGKTISRKDLAIARGDESEEDDESAEEAFSDSKSVSASEDDDDNVVINKTIDLYQSGTDESENEENFESGDKLDESDVEIRQEEDGGEKMKKFSTPDVNELEKAKAVVHQIGLWDSLLENRIRLQKSLVQFNKFPQHDVFENFQGSSGNELKEPLNKAQDMLLDLLHNLMVLQQTLFKQNTETKNILHDPEKAKQSESDEDIPSDFEDEMEDKEVLETGDEGENKERGSGEQEYDQNVEFETGNEEDEEQGSGEGDASDIEDNELESLILPRKRKQTMVIDEYCSNIAKRHAAFEYFRDGTIKKWNEKTRLASGKVSNRSFTSFDRSTLSQIKQILSDKDRLIKRTQLKRSAYRVLGKTEEDEKKEILEQCNAHLKDYDTEIFDDDDFYHQLLREFIERKSNIDPNDPIALGRQWLEIQRLRNKVKRKVDTKASKGRRLRYDVHTKLVSFMAPQVKGTMTDSSRNELFSSLFGKRQQTETVVDIAVFR